MTTRKTKELTFGESMGPLNGAVVPEEINDEVTSVVVELPIEILPPPPPNVLVGMKSGRLMDEWEELSVSYESFLKNAEDVRTQMSTIADELDRRGIHVTRPGVVETQPVPVIEDNYPTAPVPVGENEQATSILSKYIRPNTDLPISDASSTVSLGGGGDEMNQSASPTVQSEELSGYITASMAGLAGLLRVK